MRKRLEKTDFPKFLKSARTEAGRTQAAVAQAVGVAQASYADWENGKTEPALAHIIKLADYFGVTVDYLVGRETAPQPANVSGPITVRDTGDNSVNVAGSGNTVTAPDSGADKDAVIDRLSRVIAQLAEQKPAPKRRGKK